MTRMRTKVTPTTSCLVPPSMSASGETTFMRMHMTKCHLKMVSSNSTEKWRKYCIISIFHILFLMWDIWHVYLKYWYWFFFQYWLPQYFISILDEKNISFPLLFCRTKSEVEDEGAVNECSRIRWSWDRWRWNI